MARPEPQRLHDYPHSRVLTTRWIDSDPYGHMNNAIHYQLFDSVVNARPSRGARHRRAR